MDKINKLSLPIAIVLSSMILGFSYYMGQISNTLKLEKCLGNESKLYSSQTKTYDQLVEQCYKMYK